MNSNEVVGETESTVQIMQLAAEYCRAAKSQMDVGRKGEPLSRAPARLLAIHAIELYLNATLLNIGHTPKSVRGMQHDLSKRAADVQDSLKLRKRTFAHLTALTTNREYVVSRYGPEMTTNLSQTNRLMATMEELATKATALHLKMPG